MEKNLKALLEEIQEVTEFLGVELKDVNQRGNFGNTPLKVACVWGESDAVGVLLDVGADVNSKGEDDLTPLHHAVLQGHLEVAKLLLDRGAAREARDRDGHTALDLAKIGESGSIVELLEEKPARPR